MRVVLYAAHSFLGNSLKKLKGILDNVTESAIVDVKLARKNYVSSFIQAPMTEPNTGPFPQYNIIFEDVPVEALMLSGHSRKYKSRIRNQLVELLNSSTKQLARSQSLFQNPRTESQSSLMNQAKAAVSFLQDYEQFVEENSAPFQEIFIKAESLAPTGGDAPVIPPVKPRILDVNRTAELLELKALQVEEKVMLKSLQSIASKILR